MMDKQQIIEGRFFGTPHSAQSRPATLQLHDDAFAIITCGSDKRAFELDNTRISDRIGNIPRRLTFEDQTIFETNDNSAIDALLGHRGSQISAHVSWLERWSKVAVVFVLITGLALFLGYRFGVPALAGVAADLTPPAIAQLADDSALQLLDQFAVTGSKLKQERQDTLVTQFKQLAPHALEATDEQDIEFTFLLRDGGQLGANALALPGGTILVTDQLVELAQTDHEILGVVAHEMAHITENHGLKQLYRALGVSFMISILGGAGADVTAEVTSQGSFFLQLKSSREFETEADEIAVKILRQAGLPPVALADMLERLTREHGGSGEGPDWLSTHPATGARIKHIRDLSDP